MVLHVAEADVGKPDLAFPHGKVHCIGGVSLRRDDVEYLIDHAGVDQGPFQPHLHPGQTPRGVVSEKHRRNEGEDRARRLPRHC